MGVIKRYKLIQRASLKDLERRLQKNEYLCGPEISIADLVACCELDSLWFLQNGKDLLTGDNHKHTRQQFKKMIDDNPVVLAASKKSRDFAENLAEQISEMPMLPKL